MKGRTRNFLPLWILCAVALGIDDSSAPSARANTAAVAPETAPAKTAGAIPWSQIGAKAGADYQGDGLAVTPTEHGARLRCVFQRLEGEATREGLWLTSTVNNAVNERFRVKAVAVNRGSVWSASDSSALSGGAGKSGAEAHAVQTLTRMGDVSVNGQTVRFSRAGVTEEYTVSMDGVRQDFIIEAPPINHETSTINPLVVRLAVTGARVERAADGAQLVLENSGRKIAYSRLRVTDATGRELPARMEVASGILPAVEGGHPAARNSAANFSKTSLQDTPESAGLEAPALRQAEMPAATALAVVVEDAAAVYPVRIDPTFSDANWISMGGTRGANNSVRAAVVDASGNLYIGGDFTIVGNITARRIAKWDGSNWSPLYPGFADSVNALAVIGNDLYAAVDGYVYKWGSSWSPLGSGMNGTVYALAISGSDLYAGGNFSSADGIAAHDIAKWNGSSWSPLGSNSVFFGSIHAIAVSGDNVYVGGAFNRIGNDSANYIAKWDGSKWSALGSGMNWPVEAVAISGSNVYAGGQFWVAGGTNVNHIAKWDGSSWSPLGSGLDYYVNSLVVSGNELYVGGNFYAATNSDGATVVVNRIAKWNGNSWSALNSGMENNPGVYVFALTVLGSNVYAGGNFTTADWG